MLLEALVLLEIATSRGALIMTEILISKVIALHTGPLQRGVVRRRVTALWFVNGSLCKQREGEMDTSKPPTPASKVLQPTNTPERKGMPGWTKILIGVAVVILVVGAGVGTFFYMSRSWAKTKSETADGHVDSSGNVVPGHATDPALIASTGNCKPQGTGRIPAGSTIKCACNSDCDPAPASSCNPLSSSSGVNPQDGVGCTYCSTCMNPSTTMYYTINGATAGDNMMNMNWCNNDQSDDAPPGPATGVCLTYQP
jgi:hypothetical protein